MLFWTLFWGYDECLHSTDCLFKSQVAKQSFTTSHNTEYEFIYLYSGVNISRLTTVKSHHFVNTNKRFQN